jgi:hypothetical protein
MEVPTWLEFCADLLRDALTLQIDKRYYVPWLVTRPMTDFIGRGLKTQVSQFDPVKEWVAVRRESDSPPENIPFPKKITEEFPRWSDQTMESSLGMERLDFDQVIALGSMRADNRQVALIKVSDDSYTMIMVREEDDGFINDGVFEKFESYEEFLLLLVQAGQHLDFMQLGINPGLGKIWEKAAFGAWLAIPGQNVPIKLKTSRDELRKELQFLGVANALPLRVGGVRLTSGLSWEALSPQFLLMDGEGVRKWIFLAHAAPEAKVFNIYFPELSILVSEWRKLSKEEGLASDFPTSSPSVESVEEKGPEDLDDLILPIEETVIKVPFIEATDSDPVVEAVEFVAEVLDETMTVNGSSLADILAKLQHTQDAAFNRILQSHSLS